MLGAMGRVPCCVVFVALSWATVARAAPPAVPVPEGLDVQLFHPALTEGGTVGVDEVGPRHGAPFVGRALLHAAYRPLAVVEDGQVVPVVREVLQLDAVASVAVDRLRLGVVVPVVLFARMDGPGEAGLGDIDVAARVPVLPTDVSPVGVGLGARIEAPSSTTDAPLGGDALSWELDATVEGRAGPVRVVGAIAPGGGPRVEAGTAVLGARVDLRAGATVAVPAATLALEASGRVGLADPNDGSTARGWRSSTLAAEWLGSALFDLVGGAAVRIGAGTGLGSGMGAPLARLVLGVSWSGREAARDG